MPVSNAVEMTVHDAVVAFGGQVVRFAEGDDVVGLSRSARQTKPGNTR